MQPLVFLREHNFFPYNQAVQTICCDLIPTVFIFPRLSSTLKTDFLHQARKVALDPAWFEIISPVFIFPRFSSTLKNSADFLHRARKAHAQDPMWFDTTSFHFPAVLIDFEKFCQHFNVVRKAHVRSSVIRVSTLSNLSVELSVDLLDFLEIFLTDRQTVWRWHFWFFGVHASPLNLSVC